MKAALYTRYGSAEVIEIRDHPPLPAPKRNHVRVKVTAAALNPKDLLVRKGKFRFFTGRNFPFGFGYDFAGTVVDGDGFKPGARVFGMVNGWRGRTVAEELICSIEECVEMPAITFAEAAGIPLAALTALQALRDQGRVTTGSRVCINGASGGVGVFAIQIAKILGATVTTLSSEKNRDFCAELGADEPLDYAKHDPFSKSGAFDLIFDVFGNRRFASVKSALAAGGTFVSTVPSRSIIFDRLRTGLFTSRKARLVVVKSNAFDLTTLSEWIEQGRLKPVVDRSYPLKEARKAECYLETKRARGKVVILIGE